MFEKIKSKCCQVRDWRFFSTIVVAGFLILLVSTVFYAKNLKSPQVAGVWMDSFFDDFGVDLAADQNIDSFVGVKSNDLGQVVSVPRLYWESVAKIDLAGYWNFEDYQNIGPISDVSGNANVASIKGSPVLSAVGGVLDSGVLKMNGASGGYLSVLSKDNLVFSSFTSMSFSAWFKVNALNGNLSIFDKEGYEKNLKRNSGYSCFFNAFNKTVKCSLIGKVSKSVSTANQSINKVNTWYHVALVVDRASGQAKIYLNGKPSGLTADITGLGDTTNTSQPFYIGAGGSGSGFGKYYFNGDLDEVGIWRRAFSEAQITDLYQAGLVQVYNSSFISKVINTTGNFNTLKTVWQAVGDGVKVEASVGNSGKWCQMANGGGFVDTNCPTFPASGFKYRVSFASLASLDGIKFDWYSEGALPECEDGIDNDNDGFIDQNDFSCQKGGLKENTYLAVCQDKIDNDGDKLIDLSDPDCLNSQDDSETSGGATVINVSDAVVQSAVKRMGINIGRPGSYDTSLHLLKNLIPNPGFEASEMRTVFNLLGQNATSTTVLDSCWETRWNLDSAGIGHPVGFWNGADYEMVYGTNKGQVGVVNNFYFSTTTDVAGKDVDGVAKSRYTFSLSKPARPNDYDVMFVRKKFPVNQNLYPASANRPGTTGKQFLRLAPKAGTPNPSQAWYFDDGATSNGKMILIQGTWRISFWAKSKKTTDKLNINLSRLGVKGPANLINEKDIVPFKDTAWHFYFYDFNIPSGIDVPVASGAGMMKLLITAVIDQTPADLGEIDIDDLYFGLANEAKPTEANPTIFSDNAVKMLKELQPGTLRYWGEQFGESLDNQLADPYAKNPSGWTLGNRRTANYYSLADFLVLAKEVGADPWYVMPPTFTETELKNLIDYLAGPVTATSVYSNKRAQVGQTRPWTEEFDKIYIEFGNELWGGGCGHDPFKGASMGSERMSKVANDRFAIMKSNPNFKADKIKLVISGQAGSTGVQKVIEKFSTSHDITAIAPYFGTINNYDTNEKLYGEMYASPYERISPIGLGLRQSYSYVHATSTYWELKLSKPKASHELAIYEINFHTTNLGNPPEEVRNRAVTSVGGGISLAHQMLNILQTYGAKAQNAFTFMQYHFLYDDSAVKKYVNL